MWGRRRDASRIQFSLLGKALGALALCAAVVAPVGLLGAGTAGASPPSLSIFVSGSLTTGVTGTTLSGTAFFDAGVTDTSPVEQVSYEIDGPQVLCGPPSNPTPCPPVAVLQAAPSLYGWLAEWNTTTVANGNYFLTISAYDSSTGANIANRIPITVDNPPPTTSMLIPSDGATVSGVALLDAGASCSIGQVKGVSFLLSGGPNNYGDLALGGAAPSLYGWLSEWNTTDFPNGTYTLQSDAGCNTGASGSLSAPITVTVDNPPPTTTVGLPANGATVKGGTFLDASASAGVASVSYELTGGTLSDTVISGSTPTIVGWLGGFDSTTVPDGTYTLQSVACYSGGVCGTSSGTTITVENAPVAYVTSGTEGGPAIVTPIDTALNQAGTPITAATFDNGLPGPIAITPNGATAYVANVDDGGVTPIDLATGTAGPNIPVGSSVDCPSGVFSDDIVMSPDGSTAYVTSPLGCLSDMGLVTAIDTATNTMSWSVPITDASGDLFVQPNAIAVTPNGSTAYVASKDGAGPGIVTPIDVATETAGAPVNVCPSPNDIVISPDGTTAYIACQGGSVEVLDTATNTVTATIPLSGASFADAEAMTPDGQTLYVADRTSDEVIPISLATNAVDTPITVSSAPVGIVLTPDGSKAYVVGSGATVTPIDLATATAGAPISVSGSVSGATFDIAIH